MDKVTTATLHTGDLMPLLGLGTWKTKPDQILTAVQSALESGYRHIDCAAIYGNERDVGQALKEALVSVSQVIVYNIGIVYDIHKLQKAIFMYNFINNNFPVNFDNYFVTITSMHQMFKI